MPGSVSRRLPRSGGPRRGRDRCRSDGAACSGFALWGVLCKNDAVAERFQRAMRGPACHGANDNGRLPLCKWPVTRPVALPAPDEWLTRGRTELAGRTIHRPERPHRPSGPVRSGRWAGARHCPGTPIATGRTPDPDAPFSRSASTIVHEVHTLSSAIAARFACSMWWIPICVIR